MLVHDSVGVRPADHPCPRSLVAVVPKTLRYRESPTSHPSRCMLRGMKEDVPAPEAALIKRARKAIRPTLSIRAAAKKARLSEARWRQIEAGYQTVSDGTRVPAIGLAGTLARMAQVVNVSSKQLREVGRQDAANELDQLINWRDYVRPGYGARSFRRHAEIMQKPESERTPEDHAFLAAELAVTSQRQQAAAEAASDKQTPPVQPTSRQPSGPEPRCSGGT